jgi:hypothetical protein
VQRKWGPLQARAQYLFDYLTVGESPFMLSHTAQATVALTEGSRAFTQIQLRYQNKDFDPDKFEVNRGRDGKNWLGGITQYFMFAGNEGHVRIGYTYDTDRTGGGHPAVATAPSNADWAYEGHRAAIGLRVPPVWTVKLDLTADYYLQEYDNPNSFSPAGATTRRDHIYMWSGTLSKELTSYLGIAAQYYYTRDQSNVHVFDYTRSIASLTLTAKF